MFFYLKYLPGSIFVNSGVSSLADAFGYLGSLVIAMRTDTPKQGFTYAFSFMTVSAAALALSETNDDLVGAKADKSLSWIIPCEILTIKVACAACFVFLYSGQLFYFESRHLGIVMAMNNIIGRSLSILAPIVAEMEPPLPMISVAVLSLTSVCFARRLIKSEGETIELK